MTELFIGLMSGTSLDAIDAALMDFSNNHIQLVDAINLTIPVALKEKILHLCKPGYNNINRLGEADTELGILFAKACTQLLEKNHLQASAVIAIGSHGQTIRHMPGHHSPYTIQIGDPNIIASKTGITVVSDFRRRDLALGGQAAPLAPAFHNALFKFREKACWILNIGGIANLTYLPKEASQPIIGFDTGPGNTLLDSWCYKHKQQYYDHDGAWAATGNVNQTLLTTLLTDSYFHQAIPKSTGREYFNLDWLAQYLNKLPTTISAQDTQATLAELTATSIELAIKQSQLIANKIYICGGGIYNQHVLEKLQAHLTGYIITDTSEAGVSPDWIEAAAFAWFARQTLLKKPSNIPSVTGAAKESILGAIYL